MARASGTDSDFLEISSPFSSIARELYTQVTDYFFAVTALTCVRFYPWAIFKVELPHQGD